MGNASKTRQTIYLVRHAHARDRASWPSDDVDRPLDEKGHRQAEGLTHVIKVKSLARIVSSPARRCLETLAPLAEQAGLEVEPVAYLAEGADPDTALKQLLASVAALPPGSALAACSHGDVIPQVLDVVLSGDVSFEGPPGVPKGGTFELIVQNGEVTHVRSIPPR